MPETLSFSPEAKSTHATTAVEKSEPQADAFEAVMQGDRDFFLQHPERDWYVRSISPIEIAEGRATGNSVTDDALVLVGEITPGSRIRLTFWDNGLPPIEEFKAIQRQVRQDCGIKSVGLRERLRHSSKGRPKAKGFG